MDVVRVGVIGVGVMGADHVRTLSSWVSGACVAAVFDAATDRAADVAAAVAATSTATAEDLIRSRDVDAVVIAAPDPLHEGLALACLEAGKPVLCEKPLAVGSAGTRHIVDAEVALGRRLVQVGFMRRFDPAFVALRAAVTDGSIGTARLMHCLHRNVAAHPTATSPGVVSNSMIHELDHVPWLFGSPLTAVTISAPRIGKGDGDLLDTQVALLETESGALATVEVSVNARYGYDVQVEVVGDAGTARLTPPYGIERRRDGSDGREVTSDWVGRFADAYRVELATWTESVRTGIAAGPSAWDGHLATLAAEAGVRSLEGGGRVEIDAGERPSLYA
ncbi:MAG: Gfo/Idh/MocA family oxidoreductase [Nocardioidaceae bacterium]